MTSLNSRKHPNDPLPKSHAMAKTSTLQGLAQQGNVPGDVIKTDVNAHRSQLNKTSTTAAPQSEADHKLNGGKLHKQSQLHGMGGNILTNPNSKPDTAGGKLSSQSQLHGTGGNLLTSPNSTLEKGGALAGRNNGNTQAFGKTSIAAPKAGMDSVKSGPKVTPRSNLQKTSLW